MTNGEKAFLVGAALFVTLVLGLVAICWHYDTIQIKLFVEHGYTHTTLPGYSSATWVLPDSTR